MGKGQHFGGTTCATWFLDGLVSFASNGQMFEFDFEDLGSEGEASRCQKTVYNVYTGWKIKGCTAMEEHEGNR